MPEISGSGGRTEEPQHGERVRAGQAFLADKQVGLALNIPTYINLHGYGYTNVYELGEYLKVNNGIIPFDGELVDDPAPKDNTAQKSE